jgi:uncharacterized protein YdiU (UPF0061 family)
MNSPIQRDDQHRGGWRLENTYARLPAPLFTRQVPVPVKAPQAVLVNRSLAVDIGLDPDRLSSPDGIAMLAGNAPPPGSDPIAQAYAGHQFGYFTTLGDGRAILLGEQVLADGRRMDIQLKGSGATPYSRQGDGRAALGPMLREYVISEAMHALGIPTTRSLAVVLTGEPVLRDRVLAGAILTRTADSHIRVGTFEFAARCGPDVLKALSDYTIARHFATCAEASNPALALLEAVVARQAKLLAQWMHVGFIHGVMNTDNMALSGETIDYGPCAFMDTYDPDTVFSSIDHQGRYAYGRQPMIALWNLARFAETLLPLIDDRPASAIEMAESVLAAFEDQFQAAWLEGARQRLGLRTSEADDDKLIEALFGWMQQATADYTTTFTALCCAADEPPASPPFDQPAFTAWHARWMARLQREEGGPDAARAHMRRVVPAVIPRNHKVEEALSAAVDNNDMSRIHRLIEVLSKPFAHGSVPADYRDPPPSGTPPCRTFCGT